ncbi:MAG: hypothetical protein H8Z69_01245 [Nanohaloarchaea archaeon]|nr:hypothetical protein [Candidatus Nanohaloarchaea archaeon]
MEEYNSDKARKAIGYGLSFTSVSGYTALYEEDVVEFLGNYSSEFASTPPDTAGLAIGAGLLTVASFKAGAEGLKWVNEQLED